MEIFDFASAEIAYPQITLKFSERIFRKVSTILQYLDVAQKNLLFAGIQNKSIA